ncbi:MAG TPA: RNA-binding protein [Xanthobacteraceae bacterium]|nr:RNA-binding protein [Xanthobacteraceae bacterium]
MLPHAHHDALDAGPHKGGRGTERLCAVTRAVKPVDALIRFVIGPDGAVLPDLKRKLPGRGLWISADRATLNEAVARKAFARGFKRDVRVAPDLAEQTDRLLVRAALDALAIAGKSGLVAAGFAKTEAAIAHAAVVGLLHASDAGADGVAKLAAALRRHRADPERVAVIVAFTSAQLDLAFGRSNVVHAALLAGPANDTFLARFTRLERFRAGERGEGGRGREQN